MKRIISISAALLAISTTAYAGNVESFGIGARATALAGAYTATADDPFAAYYNPAGLTQLDGAMLSAGVSMMDPSLKIHKFTVEDKNGNDIFGPTNISDESDDLFVPHVGFGMPLNNQMSIGLAAYVPWGLDVEWSPNTTKNPGAYNWFHSYYLREVVTPTFAYKINDKISLGFGVSLGKSKSGAEKVAYYPTTAAQAMTQTFMSSGMSAAAASAQANAIMTMVGGTLPATKPAALAAIPDSSYQSLLLVQTANSYNNAKLKAEMEDDFNYSFNVGLMYKPTNALTLGLTYRSKTDTDFDGDLKINGIKTANVKLDYDHPDQVQVGVRYRPHDKISMEADVVWTNWKHNEYQKEYFSPYLIVPGVTSKTYDRDWHDTNQLRLGIEWQALDFMAVRAGYFYDPSPVPDNTFDIMWPDGDRKTYSIGLGFNFKENWTLDTTLQYAIAETSRVIGGESEHNLNDTYNPLKGYGLDNGARDVSLEGDGNLWGYSATVNYKF